ncbi:hypothetical protein SAMN02745148_01517 [Modicisalibacter ilicicola DSM 19980]|uniref:Uracil DNA glycosylase superfamily protein n=1 Tax=Modicisalibacter ilicicola DSM 19980 TaxID=1121942 RepID=A0A1M4XYS2_9GAMM|nr:hypothetical protein [Halomonas ilicicola]SHE98496.1 hypothetical protein SAMN02745148_01517 [Halomonas ilicicola DSM 19980]
MLELFDEWRLRDHHKDHLFISDGIIDQVQWNNSPVKILFLLKEAYDSVKTEGTWDLCGLVKRLGVSGRTFKPMAQWAYGVSAVKSTSTIVPFKGSGEPLDKALRSSAVINIKKSQGKKKSSSTNLISYVDRDWDLIEKQIQTIKPDVVICGKTWPMISSRLESVEKVSDRVYRSGGIQYIDFWHPANRASNKMNYYSLCALVQLAGG